MNSSHFQSRAPDNTTTRSSFFEVRPHLDDASHLFDEMAQGPQLAAEQKDGLHQQAKAKVLFQFFDGWPLSQSSASGVQSPALY
jgi:hypothetical protein